MVTSQNAFIRIFYLKNGRLGQVTINFDSVWHRLLFSTTKANYTAPSLSSMRTQPCAKHCCTPDRAVKSPRQNLWPATTAHSQLLTTTHSHHQTLTFSLSSHQRDIPDNSKIFLHFVWCGWEPPGLIENICMAAKNHPATTQTTKQQASAGVHTSATVCRVPSCTIGDVLRLLLLLPHQNASGNARRVNHTCLWYVFGVQFGCF